MSDKKEVDFGDRCKLVCEKYTHGVIDVSFEYTECQYGYGYHDEEKFVDITRAKSVEMVKLLVEAHGISSNEIGLE